MAFDKDEREERDRMVGRECDTIRASFYKEADGIVWSDEVEKLGALIEYTMSYYKR